MRLRQRLLGNPEFPGIRPVAVLPQLNPTRPHRGRTGGDRENLQMGKTKSPQQATGLSGWRGSAAAVVLAVVLAGAPGAEATFGGRDGALLVAVRHGTRVGPAAGLLPNRGLAAAPEISGVCGPMALTRDGSVEGTTDCSPLMVDVWRSPSAAAAARAIPVHPPGFIWLGRTARGPVVSAERA